jgi:hypothetical protein
MKTKKVKEIYKCDYCTKWFQLKWRAETHEKKCGKNPKNKIMCFDCDHFENNHVSENRKIWYCKKLKTRLSVKKEDNSKIVIRDINRNECIITTKVIRE